MTAPLSYMDAAGPASAPLTRLAWGLGGVACAVAIIVCVALLWGLLRPRPPMDSDSLQGVGDLKAGLSWIYVGLGLSVAVLAACTVWTLTVLAQVMHPATPARLTIQVTAHQWWWEVRYLDPEAGQAFTTANEIHIPAGVPVRIELTSQDVIHSFWTPKLGGKMDAIPGVTNVTWIEAAAPGEFRGQCGEFCGVEHALMAFEVIAEPPADYAAWRANQLATPAGAALAPVAEGAAVFAGQCASCHTISGTEAGGLVGPSLSHLATRKSIAAGMIPNDTDHLTAWIKNPSAIKPGVLMPAVPLSTDQRRAVVAYLQSLT